MPLMRLRPGLLGMHLHLHLHLHLRIHLLGVASQFACIMAA
jgi:hypothetical protein